MINQGNDSSRFIIIFILHNECQTIFQSILISKEDTDYFRWAVPCQPSLSMNLTLSSISPQLLTQTGTLEGSTREISQRKPKLCQENEEVQPSIKPYPSRHSDSDRYRFTLPLNWESKRKSSRYPSWNTTGLPKYGWTRLRIGKLSSQIWILYRLSLVGLAFDILIYLFYWHISSGRGFIHFETNQYPVQLW